MGPGFAAALNGAPGQDEIRRIVAIDDPVVRNLEITHCYYRLSLAFTLRLGVCANWCTFATWASKQAGQSIRGEDLIEAFTRNTFAGSVFAHPIRAFWQWLVRKGLLNPHSKLGRIANAIHSPFDAVERASAAVARGNLKVFEEIAPFFVMALERVPFPPETPELLGLAFERYERADPQMIFMANLEVGLHEQTRLQPEIQQAMDAAPATGEDLGRRALQAIYPGAWDWPAFVRRPLAATLAPIARSYARHVRRLARRIITAALMSLALPPTTIALGAEIDRGPARDLADITDPQLAALLDRFKAAGEQDWANLDYRMHMIVRIFRAFHDCEDLLQPPFTPEQMAAFSR